MENYNDNIKKELEQEEEVNDFDFVVVNHMDEDADEKLNNMTF